MENTELIVQVVYLIIWLALSVAVMYVGRKAAEQGEKFAASLGSLIFWIVPYLRRFFDPNTVVAKWITSKGVDAELADEAAEMLADALEKWANERANA